MKKGLRAKLFAFALALCLCTTMVTPAFAASGRYNSSGNRWSFSNWWNNRWNHDDDNTSDSNKSDSSETKLKLVEDQSTVAEGTELRASTYEVENTDAASNASTIKYFPVTMYNYDTNTINTATHNAEAAKASANNQSSISSWDGMYFSSGNPVKGTNGKGANEDDIHRKYNHSEYLGNNTGTAGENTYHTETYAKWNYWGADVKNADYTGNYICSGLVEKELDKSNNIVFTKTEPGLFRSDDTTNNYGKKIYTNVDLPFQYDKSKNEYSFNSNTMSARFTGDAGSNTKLTYGATPQTITDISAQGKSDNASWLPFNKDTSVATKDATYHFGMQAVIPFSMTSNGRLNADDNSTPITFDFSGDDDVWVFVDGKLVLDIGGIHNEMAGTMNFATNEWTVSKSAYNTNGNTVGDMNGQKMTGKLFTTGSEKGVLDTNRETFAATTSHTLTVFYLERGAGASNCKIKFNLPMEDSVSVKKLVSDKDSAGAAISADTQEAINNQEFAFKLFKNNEPVANTNYIILDESNQPIDTATTTSDGTFKLKNKQTAKFVGQIPEAGNTYYVQEVKEKEDGWQTPSSSYTATAANGSKVEKAANGATSAKVLIKGSNEANDQLNYTFTNVLTHVDKTTIHPQDDKIVIDYGLPVEIDPLANDVVQNGTKSIEAVTGAQFGEATIKGNKIIYTLNKQLTDVETLTYTVKATASTEIDSKTAEAKIYIIPATSMYYEENFSDMAKFSASWTNVGTSGTVYQEPGVVGTPNDSPYGSDNAYMNSSGDSYGDSCGTSKYVSTADGRSKTFKYTFTGKGTSFFARTNSNSGYMRVRVTDKDENVLHTLYRNTKYKADGELYNIPVFTWNAEKYGTYTVTVTVSRPDKAGSYGTEFWVDGIRVMNPMNPESKNLTIAQDAYAADGESNMTFATLRNALLADTTENQNGELVWDTSKGFVVFTDSNDTITSASEYKSDGPKEEVYLAQGQSVSFSLAKWDANTNHLYLGIKAPMGAGTVKLGDKSVAVNNTVDCYYDVAKFAKISEVNGVKVATLTITNPSDKIISLTNIKVTGTPDFVIIPEKNADNVNPDDVED